jgi:amphi-Trp domain-containing protein
MGKMVDTINCLGGILMRKSEKDVEKSYPVKSFVEKLRRLADCLEQAKRFQIQVDGERISIPPNAVISIEHEREGGAEEVEFQLKWTMEGKA